MLEAVNDGGNLVYQASWTTVQRRIDDAGFMAHLGTTCGLHSHGYSLENFPDDRLPSFQLCLAEDTERGRLRLGWSSVERLRIGSIGGPPMTGATYKSFSYDEESGRLLVVEEERRIDDEGREWMLERLKLLEMVI